MSTLQATDIVRLRVHPDDGRPPFTVLLKPEWEVNGILFGHEVDAEGALVGSYNSDGALVVRDHIIDTRLVTKRTPMWMNRHYVVVLHSATGAERQAAHAVAVGTAVLFMPDLVTEQWKVVPL